MEVKRYPDTRPRSANPSFFYPLPSQRDLKCMKPRLNAIEILLRSFIHYQTNYSSFFYQLQSLKNGGELSGVNCPGGELSDIRLIEPKGNICPAN